MDAITAKESVDPHINVRREVLNNKADISFSQQCLPCVVIHSYAKWRKAGNGLSEGAGIGRINIGRMFTDVILLTLIMLSQYKRNVCCAAAILVVLLVILYL